MGHLKNNVAVIGGGSWATAIVKILTENLSTVRWWVREKETEEGVITKGRNPLYLSSLQLNKDRIDISTDLNKIVREADTLVLVVPSAYVHSTLSCLNPEDFVEKNVISAIKGIVPETMQAVTDYVKEKYGVPSEQLCIISGPSHAEEIASERLTYLTAGSVNRDLATFAEAIFNAPYVNLRISKDMMGIEYAVILKNIYALAGGILRGYGFGDNLLAVFNANCLNEMIRFVNAVDKSQERNFCTAPYFGDFLVTSYSQYSRNRSFGMMIGRGYSVRTTQLEMKMIAEGYYAANCVYQINQKHKVEIPIVEMVYRILYEGSSMKMETNKLLELLK